MEQAYEGISDEEVVRRILAHKKALGKQLVILGHHYQSDQIIQLSDFTGDSYELAKRASEQAGAEFIVFCGVRFMAEAAKVLAGPGQRVFHPDTQAGCPMADMAGIDDVEEAWGTLTSTSPSPSPLPLGERVRGEGGGIPITYMNSSVEVKAFCGRHGGAVCTSSNAAKLFNWAFGKRGLTPFAETKVLFLPDEHLGRNTARAMGIPEGEIAVWDPRDEGRRTKDEGRNVRVIVWKGYCHVHTFFKPEMVMAARKKHPEAKVIVHPECPREVVELSDDNGSTSYIIKYVEKAPKGAVIFIGTEMNLVKRLAGEHADKKIFPLSPSSCPNMARISLTDLLRTLEEWPEENEVRLDSGIVKDARTALERMIKITTVGD